MIKKIIEGKELGHSPFIDKIVGNVKTGYHFIKQSLREDVELKNKAKEVKKLKQNYEDYYQKALKRQKNRENIYDNKEKPSFKDTQKETTNYKED